MATKEELIELLDAGLHFGHQTQRWNPKMKPYIFGAKNGIYILDLRKTAELLERACEAVRNAAAKGKNIVFVGTKKQANEVVKEEALRAGSFYINRRWLGGMITNYETIRGRINKLRELESFMESGHSSKLPKKEVAQLNRQLAKLSKTLGGIKDMKGMADMLVVIDQRKELNAITEAKKAGIPVVCLADTNANPDNINYIIPGNDDAIRSIKLVVSKIADAILEGKEMKANKIDANKAKVEKIEAKDANVEEVPEKVEKMQAEDVGINLDELK